MRAIDLVIHDWMNLPLEERELVLRDIKALAEDAKADFTTRTIPALKTPIPAHRRMRALNLVASFMHFFSKDVLNLEMPVDEPKKDNDG